MWTRAAVALVGRGGLGDPTHTGNRDAGNMWGPTFVEVAARRFPDDAWLRLAKLVWTDPTGLGLERLTEDPEVGSVVLIELAFRELSRRDLQLASRLADQAANRAAEPSTRYLAHYIAALCHEAQGRYQDAVREYSAALRAVPRAQSASIALGILLLRDNQANAAYDLINRSLTERPDGDDPWRLFAYRGYVRWPVLIADVRKAIR